MVYNCVAACCDGLRMPVMAKPRPKPKMSATKQQAPATKRAGKPLHVWIPEALRDAIDKAAEVNRRHLTSEVEIALEEYLTKQGLWPPPGEEE